MFVARELLKDGNKFVNHNILGNGCCEVADSVGDGSSNHRGFFVAELNELSKNISAQPTYFNILSEFFFMCTGSGIDGIDKVHGRNSTSKPLVGCKSENLHSVNKETR